MKAIFTLALIAITALVQGQNFISIGGEYKRTNSAFNQGAGFDVGMQFVVNERLTLGPQAGYNYFRYRYEWSYYDYGAGDIQIENRDQRGSFFGGASAHYLLLGLDRKLQLHVGLGLNCHVFQELEKWHVSSGTGRDLFARVEAELPVTLVYTPNSEKRLRIFTSLISGYMAHSNSHKNLSYAMGQDMVMLSLQAGVQIALGAR